MAGELGFDINGQPTNAFGLAGFAVFEQPAPNGNGNGRKPRGEAAQAGPGAAGEVPAAIAVADPPAPEISSQTLEPATPEGQLNRGAQPEEPVAAETPEDPQQRAELLARAATVFRAAGARAVTAFAALIGAREAAVEERLRQARIEEIAAEIRRSWDEEDAAKQAASDAPWIEYYFADLDGDLPPLKGHADYYRVNPDRAPRDAKKTAKAELAAVDEEKVRELMTDMIVDSPDEVATRILLLEDRALIFIDPSSELEALLLRQQTVLDDRPGSINRFWRVMVVLPGGGSVKVMYERPDQEVAAEKQGIDSSGEPVSDALPLPMNADRHTFAKAVADRLAEAQTKGQ